MSLPTGVLPFEPSDPGAFGRHRVLGRLGAGGMGVVYLADGPLGIVAVKTIRRELAADSAFRTRFMREVQACFRVSGSCTVKLLDFDLTAGEPWLATEFVDAPNLEQMVSTSGPLREDAQFALALGLADALVTLHALGVTHRDLKPSNVLCPEGGVKVIDFGIAAAEDTASQTATSQMIGTPAWLSPERLAGGRTVPASDIFAWAGIVSYAACGWLPFGGDHARAMYNIVHGEPEVDYQMLGEPLRHLVTTAFNRSPQARPTAGELLEQLTAALAAPRAGAGEIATEPVTAQLGRLLEGTWETALETDRPDAPPTVFTWLARGANSRIGTLLDPEGKAFAVDVTLTQAGELLVDKRAVIRIGRNRLVS